MRFKANVQYDDWKGTAAADDADLGALSKHLRDNSLLSESEFLIGFEAYVGATTAKGGPYFSSRAYIIQAADYENAKDAVQAQDPLPVQTRDIDLDLDGFFKLFKRFNFVLTHRGLDIEDKEYREVT